MVTIGLSFCNDRTTLAGAIRGVFAQTISNWQLILVDDGSRTDRWNLPGPSGTSACTWSRTDRTEACPPG